MEHSSIKYNNLYLVGVNKTNVQTLIQIRYNSAIIPTFQLVHKGYNSKREYSTVYTDLTIVYSDKRIEGGVRNFKLEGPIAFTTNYPRFAYIRDTGQLKFFLTGIDSTYEIMPDTAKPFVELIKSL